MNHTMMNVSQQYFPNLTFVAERNASLYCPRIRRPRLLTDVDAGNSHGVGTTQSTSSQVPTWATPHTDRFCGAIQHRPSNSFKNTLLFALSIPVSIPSPPQYLTPDAVVFLDRCLRIPTGGGFVGKSSRW